MSDSQIKSGSVINAKMAQGHLDISKMKAERGFIGGLFGSGGSVSRNVASLVCIFSLAMLLYVLWKWLCDNTIEISEVVSILSGLITLSIGYLFGRAGKNE